MTTVYAWINELFNASFLIASDIDIVTLSGRLGHADKSLTYNVYGHIIKSKEKEAVNKASGGVVSLVEPFGRLILVIPHRFVLRKSYLYGYKGSKLVPSSRKPHSEDLKGIPMYLPVNL